MTKDALKIGSFAGTAVKEIIMIFRIFCVSFLVLVSLSIATAQITETKLVATDGAIQDLFGTSVSISGDNALVGAWGDDDKGSGTGSAYIFHFDGSNWVEQTKLIASDAAAGDWFGWSVSLSGDYALVGAPGDEDRGWESGSAYIFHFDGSNWIEQTKLIASDGNVNDYFGGSVTFSGDYALVGAGGDDRDDDPDLGSAYIFHYDGSNWVEQTKLIASDAAPYDFFGLSVSLSGDYALVGVLQDNDNINGHDAGSAYIFHFDGSNWIQRTKLTASDGAAFDYFGRSVSLSGDYALVGAQRDNENGHDAGSAYIFHFDGSNWVEQAKLIASDGAQRDRFGASVSLSGDYALVGADGDDDNGTDAGSAYVYEGFLPRGPLAQYGVLYGSTGSAEPTNPGALITIDPLTGVGTLVGTTGIIGDIGPSVPALATKSTGEMYAVSASTSSSLYTVDASTGAGTLVGNTGLSLPGAMAFDRFDDLYIVDGTDNLYTVDETNGAAVLIGPLGFNARGIAFDPTDGVLYGSSGTDEIYTVDPTTGTSTLVGLTELGGATPDIHFDQQGNLFGTKVGAGLISDLISIDKQTGMGTTIGSTGFAAVIGLSARLKAFPSQVELLSPPAGEVIAENSAVFLWHASEPLVDRYWFELSADSLFSSPTVDSTLTDSTTTINLDLETGSYWWRARAHNVAGWGSFSEAWNFSVLITDVDDQPAIPGEFSLSQNYPNPFNPTTTIRYGLPQTSYVKLEVFSMLGQRVATLVDEDQEAGYHARILEAGTLASGIYLYRLRAGDFVESKRMLLLK